MKTDFTITLTTWIGRGQRRYDFDNETIRFTSSSNQFLLDIPLEVSNNNSPYEVEVNVILTDCSRCASGWGDPLEPTGQCNEQPVFQGGQPIGYNVAKPRWNATASFTVI